MRRAVALVVGVVALAGIAGGAALDRRVGVEEQVTLASAASSRGRGGMRARAPTTLEKPGFGRNDGESNGEVDALGKILDEFKPLDKSSGMGGMSSMSSMSATSLTDAVPKVNGAGGANVLGDVGAGQSSGQGESMTTKLQRAAQEGYMGADSKLDGKKTPPAEPEPKSCPGTPMCNAPQGECNTLYVCWHAR